VGDGVCVVAGGEVMIAVAGWSSAGAEALGLGRWNSGAEGADGFVATASPVSSPAIEAVAVNATVANSASTADSRTQTMPPHPFPPPVEQDTEARHRLSSNWRQQSQTPPMADTPSCPF
jgi:hypothetical protein